MVNRLKQWWSRIDWSSLRPEDWAKPNVAWPLIIVAVLLGLVLLADAIARDAGGDASDGAGRRRAAPAPDTSSSSSAPTSSPSASGTTCDTSQAREEVSVGVVSVGLDDASPTPNAEVMRNLDAVKASMRCRFAIEPEFVGETQVSKAAVRCKDMSKWGRDADKAVGIDTDEGEVKPYEVTLYVVEGASCKFDGMPGAAVSRYDTGYDNAGDAYVLGPPKQDVLAQVIDKALGRAMRAAARDQ